VVQVLSYSHYLFSVMQPTAEQFSFLLSVGKGRNLKDAKEYAKYHAKDNAKDKGVLEWRREGKTKS
jgi:hypothetical protein